MNEKHKDDFIAKKFICPICNLVIECMYNNARMNNHITKCI